MSGETRTATGAGNTGPLRFGPYSLETRIAVGGTAEVYLARPTDPELLPRTLVVKRLLPHFVHDPDGRTMFEREAKLHAAVQHENVVTVFGSGTSEDGEPYLAMEYIDGVDAFRLLRRMTQANRPMPTGVAVYLACEVLRGLECVHRALDASGQPIGIIHRDVTPSNIYLSKDGRVKLGDFGIARSTSRATLKSADGTLLKGKFAYLAPEQVAGEPFDHRADLFSLAAVLVEAMIGRPLFSGSGQLSVLLAIRDCRLDPIQQHKDKLPAGLYDVLVTALARDPGKRFQSASAFGAALQPFLAPDGEGRKAMAELVCWAQTTSSSAAMQAVRDSVRALRVRPPPLPPSRSAIPKPPVPTPAARRKVEEITLDVEPDSEPPPPNSNVPTPRVPSDGGEFRDEHEKATGSYSRLPSFVETTRGVRHGPWAYARLVEQLAIGAIGRGDKVDFLGTGFRPVEEIEELARFLPAKTATTSQVPGLGSPDTSEAVSEATVLALLVRVAGMRETGVAFVDRPAAAGNEAQRKELYFVDGRLHHVASSNASELIGQFLVRRGMLSRDELDFALAVLPRYGGRIGDTLISLGLVSAVDMFRAIRDAGRDRVAEIFSWKTGKLAFYRDQTAPHVEFPLELEAPALMLAGMEAAQPGDALVERYRARLDAWLVPAAPGESPLEAATWPDPVLRVRRALTATMRLRDLLGAATARDPKAREAPALSAGDVLRALTILLSAGLCTFK